MVNMFGNIAFLNEGEQAEEYKRKKAEEAAKKEKEEEERRKRRYGEDHKYSSFTRYYDSGSQARKYSDIGRKDQIKSGSDVGKAHGMAWIDPADKGKSNKDDERHKAVDNYMRSKNPYNNATWDEYESKSAASNEADKKSRDADAKRDEAYDKRRQANKGFGKFTAAGKKANAEYQAARDDAEVARGEKDKAEAEYWKASDKLDKEKSYYNSINTPDGRDVVNRHMRRHPEQWDGGKYIGPKKESSIFESVTFLNETNSEEE